MTEDLVLQDGARFAGAVEVPEDAGTKDRVDCCFVKVGL